MMQSAVRQETTRPPGVLPRNLSYWVFGGIALIVVTTSFFSGQRAQKVHPTAPVQAPTAIQLKDFSERLKQQREQERQQLEARLRREEEERQRTLSVSSPIGGSSGVVDPFAQRRKEREAAAPFASNVVAHIEPKQDGEVRPAAPQVVFRAEQPVPAPPENVKPQKTNQLEESGHRLVMNEGTLHRLIEGTLIQTTLANRLDGSFTGPVLCRVTQDVYADKGVALLIPKNSRFIGQAQRVEAQSQVRLAVSFKRLILANNSYSVDLEKAPGLDRAGATGLKDKVDNHYLSSFGISGAIGLLGGVALYGRTGPYGAGVANMMGSSATNILSRFLNRVPTITIREGQPVTVYLPNDLILPEYRP